LIGFLATIEILPPSWSWKPPPLHQRSIGGSYANVDRLVECRVGGFALFVRTIRFCTVVFKAGAKLTIHLGGGAGDFVLNLSIGPSFTPGFVPVELLHNTNGCRSVKSEPATLASGLKCPVMAALS